MTKGDIRRLARRGGVKRISSGIYPEVRMSIRLHLEKVPLPLYCVGSSELIWTLDHPRRCQRTREFVKEDGNHA